MPSATEPCRLFSENCQLYPCQPVRHYTSFTKKDYDQSFIHRESQKENSSLEQQQRECSSRLQERKYHQYRRHITLAIHNQHHLVNRYMSIQRTQNRLDDESRRLHERLAEKKIFGRAKEHRHHLSQDIQRHLEITARFCA